MADNIRRRVHPLKHVAAVTGKHPATLRRLVKSGALPVVYIGASVMVADEVLERILHEGIPRRSREVQPA